MKVIIAITFFLLFAYKNSFAQEAEPVLKWQHSFGGNGLDRSGAEQTIYPSYSRLFQHDRDGGYIIGGITSSNDGDITGNHGGSDIWVAKLDSAKNIVWSKSIGGSQDDYIYSIQVDNGGGYILGCATTSTDGDVTSQHGGGDAWVIKLDNAGNIVWQKCYGGTLVEYGNQIQVLGDAGYVFVTTSYSSDGDVTVNHGSGDVWVVRISAAGDILWQKCLGGSGVEYDQMIQKTNNNGFIILAATRSEDGDATVTEPFTGGNEDMWIIKLEMNGSIEWKQRLGGTNFDYAGDIDVTADGGYIVSGSTAAMPGISVKGMHDAYLAKLNAAGEIVWQKNFGGSRDDAFSELITLPDNNYLVIGGTESIDMDVQMNHGYGDYWLVKIDQQGELIWEKTFGGTNLDIGATITPLMDGSFMITGLSNSNDLDVSGNHGSADIWVLQVGASNTIVGNVFYDKNSNGVQDIGEAAFDDIKVTAQRNSTLYSAIPAGGFYRVGVDSGTYVITANPDVPYYSVMPASGASSFNSFFNTDTVNFSVQPVPGQQDLTINVIPLTPARPGAQAYYSILYKNIGTQDITGASIRLIPDPRLTFISAEPVQTSIINDTISWDIGNLSSLDTGSVMIGLQVAMPPDVNNGDMLTSATLILPVTGDLTPLDDTATLKQVVTGSFDPNDKTEANAGVITPEQVSGGEYLNYLIRFQNTGTDTAFNVVVRDTLDDRLDPGTLQMLTASHAYNLAIEDDEKLTWTFAGILLPDSNVNEPASHGYIAYRVKPKPTVAVGDTIHNFASIYFDFNLPVMTNNAFTILLNNVPLPVTLSAFTARLQGNLVKVEWKTATESNVKHFEVQRSTDGVDFVIIGMVTATNAANGHDYDFTDKNPVNGANYYRLKVVDMDDAVDHSAVVLVNVNSVVSVVSSIYPNPTNGKLVLKLHGTVKGNLRVQVMDHLGREVMRQNLGKQNASQLVTTLELGKLAKGSYILKIAIDEQVYLHKLLIQ